MKAAWNARCEELRMKQTQAGEALVAWFLNQPPEMQLRALGLLPDVPAKKKPLNMLAKIKTPRRPELEEQPPKQQEPPQRGRSAG